VAGQGIMKTKDQILRDFSLFSVPVGGIGNWLTEKTDADVFERLGRIDEQPLSAVQLNQLLVLGHEAPASDGFFRYYWLTVPEHHPYRVQDLKGYDANWTSSESIVFPGSPEVGFLQALYGRATLLWKYPKRVPSPAKFYASRTESILQHEAVRHRGDRPPRLRNPSQKHIQRRSIPDLRNGVQVLWRNATRWR
jgi:hypothetical protein